MSFLQFLRDPVQSVSSGIAGQQNITQGVLDQIKGYPPLVSQSWIGGDEKEFEADVARKLVPAMTELIAAIAGVNLNLTKATGIVDQADNQSKGLADNLGDVFSQI
ncbi:MAG: hypothetical protein HY023_12035 [Chloroflexi bacterium]|nr:hypothetical protein [Chloroflexota bacterium]